MKVFVSYKGKKEIVQLKEKSSVRQLLEKMEINPETVLVGRKGEIIPETEQIRDKDRIELIRTVSGG